MDATLSFGYRVDSKRGTQFHIWPTGTANLLTELPA